MSTVPNYFDPFHVPLTGINFIEASAGTGKTYGIASIYVRLIILEQLSVEHILVLTFSKAATEELKKRLRQRLIDVKEALGQDKIPHPDNFLNELLCIIKKNNLSFTNIYGHVEQEIERFNQAEIYTLHAFSKHLLQQENFITGSPLHIDIVNEHTKQIKEYIKDYLRQYISNDPLISELFFLERETPNSLYYSIRSQLYQRKLNDFSQQSEEKIKYLHKWEEIKKQLFYIKEQLNQYKADSFIALFGKKIINENKFRLSIYQELIKILQEPLLSIYIKFSDKRISERLYKACEKLSFKSEFLIKNISHEKKIIAKNAFLEISFLEKIPSLIDDHLKYKKHLISLEKDRLIYYVQQRLIEYKKSSITRSYDDLLTDLQEVLQRQNSVSQKLIQKVNQQYRYIMLDEFQDTDKRQSTIIKYLFINPQIPLFFVGDPKQSIYRFRGADINIYSSMKQVAHHHFTMSTNYRSTASLVHIINHLFNAPQQAFKNKSITFHPVKPYREPPYLVQDNKILPSLVLIRAQEKKISEQVAQYIDDLLLRANQGKLSYKDRLLHSQDIAILVSKHSEAEDIVQALSKKSINAITEGKKSIYATTEAMTVLIFLKTVYQVHYICESQPNLQKNKLTQKINYLLASPLWNKNAKDIAQTNLIQLLPIFQDFLDYWKNKNIFAAFQWLKKVLGFEERLIQKNQLRILTNLNHLFELLAQQSLITAHPLNLIDNLEDKIHHAKEQENDDIVSRYDEENTALRLESDEQLVQVLTIHAAKGLQYPIVICPFLYKLGCQKKQVSQAQIDSDLEDDEKQQELMRQLYVAMTRAEEQLVLCIGEAAGVLNHLLINRFSEEHFTHTNSWQLWQDWYERLPFDKLTVQLIEDFPQVINDWQQHRPPLKPAINQPDISRPISEYNSYTAINALLNKSAQSSIDHQSKEIEQKLEIPVRQPLTILNIPGGTAAGIFWHKLLENIDFHQPIEQQLSLLQQINNYPAISSDHQDHLKAIVISTLENTIHAFLAKQLSLIDFAAEQVIKEMTFTLYFANSLSLKIINQWLESYYPDFKLDKLYYPQILEYDETYLTGVIDCLAIKDDSLYLIDYKSNFLGDHISDYEHKPLTIAILKHHYQLQALLYTLAAYRQCQISKFPIKHFCIRYLFLRGLDKKSDRGIWQWNISNEQIKELDRRLHGLQ